MTAIITLSFKIVLLLYLTGYGLTVLLLPKNLKEDLVWIVPWVGIILISFTGITLSLAKIPMQYASYFIIFLSAVFIAISFFQKRINFSFTKEHLAISLLLIFGLGFNLFVLINKVSFPTTISLLNTDPVTYSYTADFLVNHTLYEGDAYEPFKNYLGAVGTLLHAGYRWGSPIILSFFDSTLKVKSYEIYTILITIFFVLTFPLVYVLAKLLTGKKSYLLLFLTFLTYGLNSTLLYILYNAFFGQIVFDGLLILVIILGIYYVSDQESKTLFSRTSLLLASALGSIAAIYPDGFLYTALPFFVWMVLRVCLKKHYAALVIVGQIALLMLLIMPTPVILALKQNFNLFLASLQNTTPSWEQVRYATPLDMTGFYNLYYYKKLPWIASLIFSLAVVFIWFIGFVKSKAKYFLTANLIVFGLFCLIFIFKNNFFVYLRLVTYTLFIHSILFSIGLIAIFSLIKYRLVKGIIIFLIVFLALRSADRTLRRSYWHTMAVDKSIVSLRELNDNKQVAQPIFMSELYIGEGNFWQKVWEGYMLNDKKVVTLENYKGVQEFFPHIKLVLSEKKNAKVVHTNIVWQNKYYILGEIKPMELTDSLLNK